jgi:hypothetical protein
MSLVTATDIEPSASTVGVVTLARDRCPRRSTAYDVALALLLMQQHCSAYSKSGMKTSNPGHRLRRRG